MAAAAVPNFGRLLQAHPGQVFRHQDFFYHTYFNLPIRMRVLLQQRRPPIVSLMDVATAEDDLLIATYLEVAGPPWSFGRHEEVPAEYRRLRSLAVGIVLGADMRVLRMLSTLEPAAEPEPQLRPTVPEPEPEPGLDRRLKGTVALLDLRSQRR